MAQFFVRKNLKFAIRYGLVGAAGASYSILTFYFLSGVMIGSYGYLIGALLVTISWLPVAYWLHARFVFRLGALSWLQFGGFVASQWVIWLFSPSLLVLFVEGMQLAPMPAYLLTMSVSVVVSFVLIRAAVFRAA